ncbi:hypothetical protein VFPFJ_04822 [Purpureocillium lilacinum]|uniref:Uncharacterized protein n=1 Tax=Purpureocillium lilacinum TaxID=33203 RepID=A0A179HMR8_PURLI|nr:hypothetical protein VFPFJ_04822 [Purpureocillium lilacinum]OAQ90663.1 hypothetical protein VFPFJ_04822 [Purpureocillium lilacinum]
MQLHSTILACGPLAAAIAESATEDGLSGPLHVRRKADGHFWAQRGRHFCWRHVFKSPPARWSLSRSLQRRQAMQQRKRQMRARHHDLQGSIGSCSKEGERLTACPWWPSGAHPV